MRIVEDCGPDEVILSPTVADIDQVDRLAELVAQMVSFCGREYYSPATKNILSPAIIVSG